MEVHTEIPAAGAVDVAIDTDSTAVDVNTATEVQQTGEVNQGDDTGTVYGPDGTPMDASPDMTAPEGRRPAEAGAAENAGATAVDQTTDSSEIEGEAGADAEAAAGGAETVYDEPVDDSEAETGSASGSSETASDAAGENDTDDEDETHEAHAGGTGTSEGTYTGDGTQSESRTYKFNPGPRMTHREWAKTQREILEHFGIGEEDWPDEIRESAPADDAAAADAAKAEAEAKAAADAEAEQPAPTPGAGDGGSFDPPGEKPATGGGEFDPNRDDQGGDEVNALTDANAAAAEDASDTTEVAKFAEMIGDGSDGKEGGEEDERFGEPPELEGMMRPTLQPGTVAVQSFDAPGQGWQAQGAAAPAEASGIAASAAGYTPTEWSVSDANRNDVAVPTDSVAVAQASGESPVTLSTPLDGTVVATAWNADSQVGAMATVSEASDVAAATQQALRDAGDAVPELQSGNIQVNVIGASQPAGSQDPNATPAALAADAAREVFGAGGSPTRDIERTVAEHELPDGSEVRLDVNTGVVTAVGPTGDVVFTSGGVEGEAGGDAGAADAGADAGGDSGGGDE